MVFKINVAHKGKTAKFERDSEEFIGKKIGDKIDGKIVSGDFEDYELEITGTSDKAGFAGLPEEKGSGLRKVLLTYGRGLHKRPRGVRKKGDKPKGLRYRKTYRGNEISEDIVQINMKVLKEGRKKFEELIKPKEESNKSTDKKVEQGSDKVDESPATESKNSKEESGPANGSEEKKQK